MSNPKHLNVTPRAFLASLNPPLAVAVDEQGRPARGRLSTKAHEALATARADGFLFLGDEGNENNPVEEKKERKTAAPKPAPADGAAPAAPRPTVTLPEVDAKAVRAWAKQNGHEVKERGRIHRSVVTAFLASGGKPVVARAKAPSPADMPKVRAQSVGWAVEKSEHGGADRVIAYTTCGGGIGGGKVGCGKPVNACKCQSGPVAPHYLNTDAAGKPLLLAKPVV